MAVVHKATLAPTKLQVMTRWLPEQEWFGGDPTTLLVLGAYRFDDVDGEVGIQAHIVQDGDGVIYQVPMTYRAAPLPGGDQQLMAELEHSVLGRRFVYDGSHDPVFLRETARAALTGASNVTEWQEQPDGADPVALPASMQVHGTGGHESVAPEAVEVALATTVAPIQDEQPPADSLLIGDWGAGQYLLATVQRKA